MEKLVEKYFKLVSGASKTSSLSEDQIHLLVTLLGAYSVSRSTVIKYTRKYSLPLVIIVLIARARSADFGIGPFKDASLLSAIQKSISSALLGHGAIRRVIEDALGLMLLFQVFDGARQLSMSNLSGLRKSLMEGAYDYVKILPQVQAILTKEKQKLEESFEHDLKIKSRSIGGPNSKHLNSLPLVGLEHEEVLTLMRAVTEEENITWQTGRISGAVYHGVKQHQDLLNAAFGFYSISNPLHPDVWPSCMKCESEIIAMTSSLVSGGISTVCGCTTSGGTESIILAIKSHRDYYTAKYNIAHPELVACITAHAAVDKACDMMGIKLIKVAMDPVTCKADLAAVKRAIGPNTIMLYASAPNYPQGAIDPIRDMGKLAVKYNIGMHVDCCLGGFFLPFAKKLGHPVPDFDFSVPGVTSMSLDTHKYGYALKGTSVVLYRTPELRQCQYFCYADWSGGLYTTPTIASSRSGGLIAQCWASMVAMGEAGYMKCTADILGARAKIAAGIKSIKGLKLFGDGPETAMIVCFVGDGPVNIYNVADKMSKKGWSLNSHQHPPSIHVCCTVRHVGREDELLHDLREVVGELLSDPTSAGKGGNAAIYGMTSSLPSGPVNELLKIYNDVVLKF